ncbi:MAG: KEOPS complex subunit Cgi121 [Nitrososphaerales archaeon]|jgi:tRNA threonylcarbamoyladenosine modification (KEOPS) complex Cgi121 subunit
MEAQVVSIVIRGGVDPGSVRKTVAAKLPGSIVQTVRADAATNGFFVEMIAAQTLSANGTQNLLAKKPEVDLLLRLAGTTQISRAIEQMGVKKGEPFLLVIAGPARGLDDLGAKELGGSELERRELSSDELNRIEQAALLNGPKA